MSSPTPRITELRSAADFAPHAVSWSELLATTPGAVFFQSPQWQGVFAASMAERERLRMLLLHEADRLTGILPLAVLHERNRLGTLRSLTWPLRGWGTFFGPIGPDPRAVLRAGFDHLREQRRDYDVIQLSSVPELVASQLRADEALLAEWRMQIDLWSRAPLVRLTEGWDAYWAARTSKHRNNLRRSQRLLSALGELRHVRYRPRGRAAGEVDPRWDLYDACTTVAGQSWQARAIEGNTLTHTTVREFLRQAHLAAVEAGAVDVNLLYAGERPLAFAYNYFCGGQVCGLRMGFDPSASRDGAGSVLMWKMLEDSAARGDQSVDLGAGYVQCKQHWYNDTVNTWRFVHYPAGSPKAQLLRLKRAINGRLEPRAPDGARLPALRDATK